MSILERFRIDDRVAIVTGAPSGLGSSRARSPAGWAAPKNSMPP
jgi:NADP-dependent 3-hydroxy acid dehydrogenase YdfG